MEEHVAGKHTAQVAPAAKDKSGSDSTATAVKQPPMNSEPTKKPVSGVPKPDQAATDKDAATAVKDKVSDASEAAAL